MKILSNTDTGGRVVEFSEDEFKEFYALAKSCNPQAEDVREASYSEIYNFDFTEVFGNIRAFRDMQYVTNKLQNIINSLKDAVKQK
jgi:hypothetical protein